MNEPIQTDTPVGRPSRRLNPEQIARRARAVSLRVAGFSYRQIATEMGIDLHDAHDLVRRELEDTTDVTRHQIREERQIEFTRLEKIINRCWTKAFPADLKVATDYDAIRTILRAMERKAKLLGLEAPQKHQVDLAHLNNQVGLVVEMIARVIPDDSVPKVYEVVEEAMRIIDSRERALAPEEAV